VAALASVLTLACGGGGGGEPAPPLPRDLIRDLATARIQPAATADVARVGEIAGLGESDPVLLLAAPARLTWAVRFPEAAELEASVGLAGPAQGAAEPRGVTLRIGIADDRSYDELARLPLHPSGSPGIDWHPIRVNLGAYFGAKLSLFYRPSRISWNLTIAVDPTPDGTVVWRTLRLQAAHAPPR
jgi:hypothetical protein